MPPVSSARCKARAVTGLQPQSAQRPVGRAGEARPRGADGGRAPQGRPAGPSPVPAEPAGRRRPTAPLPHGVCLEKSSAAKRSVPRRCALPRPATQESRPSLGRCAWWWFWAEAFSRARPRHPRGPQPPGQSAFFSPPPACPDSSFTYVFVKFSVVVSGRNEEESIHCILSGNGSPPKCLCIGQFTHNERIVEGTGVLTNADAHGTSHAERTFPAPHRLPLPLPTQLPRHRLPPAPT